MNFDKLTNYLDGLKEQYGVPQTEIIITKDYETVYHHLTGYSDFDETIPASEKDGYYFYSASKVMTMTAVMREIENGRIHLYDPVCKYLPEFEVMTVINREFSMAVFPPQMPTLDEPRHYAANQIRIIDLMAMMGGLTYDLSGEPVKQAIAETDGKGSTREIVAAIAKMPLAAEPGTRWIYSLGHDVLAAVVEVASGERFGDYLKKYVFDPAGADEIGFVMPEGIKLTAQYAFDPREQKILPTSDKNPFILTENYESGGAGLMGTASAYSKVIEALANGGVTKDGKRILAEDSIKMFMHAVTTGQAQEEFAAGGKGPTYGYGLGVRVKRNMETGRSPIGEFGWDGAAGAYTLIDPINHISIFHAQHVLGFLPVYLEIHPMLRDLAYEGLGI